MPVWKGYWEGRSSELRVPFEILKYIQFADNECKYVNKRTCKGRFTRSNFSPIIISNFFVYNEKCWRSHNPIFPSNYFVMYSRETRQFLFWEFRPISPQLGPAVAAILEKYSRIEQKKIKNWRLFWSNRMEIEHVLFSSNTKKMSETCQKLAFTHPVVVWKSGLKNKWKKRLDRVNRP